MNWTAVFVVTGLSTLFMLLQYAVNQRQYDFNMDSPLEHPIIRQPPRVGADRVYANQQAVQSSSPNRHRGINVTFDARSAEDDCFGSSYMSDKSRPQATPPPPSHGSEDVINRGSYAQPQDGGGADCTGRKPPIPTANQRDTGHYPLHRSTYCNSDESIDCGGDAQNLNSARRGAHSTSSSPCQSSADHSFEYGEEARQPSSDVNAANTGTVGRRCSAEAIEIVTGPCDEAADAAEASEEAEGDEGEDCEPPPPPPPTPCRRLQRGSWRRQCEQSGVALSRSLDYLVRVLAVLLVLLLIIQWIIQVRNNRWNGGGDDDDAFCRLVMGDPFWLGCKRL